MPQLASSTSPLSSSSSTPNGRWQRAVAKTRAASSAADMTAAARLKALQKTPLPMVIARMKLIYDAGQHASNFYIILSGRIDIWTHPPGSSRPKSIVSVLRKGDTFGDQAIINKARHSTAASPGSNASLLVVSQEGFLQVFGPYFQGVATTRTQFLTTSVQRLCSAMVSSKPPAGKEFDLQQEQVFFIQEGTFEMQLIDLAAQRAADVHLPPPWRPRSDGQAAAAAASAGCSSEDDRLLDAAAAAAGFAAAAGPGLGDLPALAQHGVLASVRVKDGRALGTLGYERELRRQRQASVPRRAVTMLGPGSWFGGGGTVYGSGQLLLALRVVAKGSSCELIHLPLDSVAQQGGGDLIRRLRDDAAFSLTYHLGRLGLLPPGASIGHPQASLLSASAASVAAAAESVPGAPSSAAAAASLGAWGGIGSTSDSVPTTPKMPAALLQATQHAAAAAAPGAAAAGVEPPAASACGRVDGSTAANVAANSNCEAGAAGVGGTLRRHGRQRQKHVHVAGSGLYSPATMAALQHVSSLLTQCTAGRDSRGAGAGAGKATESADRAAALTAGCSNSSRPGSPTQVGSSSSSSSRPASSKHSRASVRSSSILAGPGDTASSAAAAAAGDGYGETCIGSSPSSGQEACAWVGRGCSGAVTAAERYWAQPGHASSGVAAGLSPLLSSLFPDGLQPLVHELDGLLVRAQAQGRPSSAAARLQQAPAAAVFDDS
ncbi:hypothetical protein COO60DRAFT_1640983 [Scenedesmus sp. NREL 46B-D3]|nr:hypothetical protein COO60DRAFT_1640983 [Scenedesmus sp. NREL 46B-D3]